MLQDIHTATKSFGHRAAFRRMVKDGQSVYRTVDLDQVEIDRLIYRTSIDPITGKVSRAMSRLGAPKGYCHMPVRAEIRTDRKGRAYRVIVTEMVAIAPTMKHKPFVKKRKQ